MALAVVPDQQERRKPAWLVLIICEHCNFATERYCSGHDLSWLDRQKHKTRPGNTLR